MSGMPASCFVCGNPIPPNHLHPRRRVQTGEWVRFKYPKPNLSSVQTHYGMRIVCSFCAARIDRQKKRSDIARWIHLVVAVTVLLALIAFELRQ